ncbi:hypothetical protein LC593_36075, partial [Nostoc sp. CHAB 5844]|nr:hypothetical protein [Nostoc sp. CHAB 5844]
LTKLQSRDDANPRSKILASNQTITSYLGYRSLWFNYLKIAVSRGYTDKTRTSASSVTAYAGSKTLILY